jgi:hypothetical protein
VVQFDDTVREKLEVVVGRLGRPLGRKEDRRVGFGEKSHERDDLLAELEGVAGQISELRNGVQKDAVGFALLNFLDDAVGERLLFDFVRFEDAVRLVVGKEVRLGTQIQKRDVREVESERGGVLTGLLFALFEVDEQRVGVGVGSEKLVAEDGLASTGWAANEVAPASQEAAVEYLVQPRHACRESVSGRA